MDTLKKKSVVCIHLHSSCFNLGFAFRPLASSFKLELLESSMEKYTFPCVK